MLVVKPAPRVVSRVIEGQALLLDATSDTLERLNAVGTFIWARIKEGRHDVATIHAALVDAFAVDPAQARADLDAFLAQLDARGLIRREDDGAA